MSGNGAPGAPARRGSLTLADVFAALRSRYIRLAVALLLLLAPLHIARSENKLHLQFPEIRIARKFRKVNSQFQYI
jgi:hypothetical protein